MPYDFSHMWHLKNKTNEQTNNTKFTETENRLVVVREEAGWGVGRNGQRGSRGTTF